MINKIYFSSAGLVIGLESMSEGEAGWEGGSVCGSDEEEGAVREERFEDVEPLVLA